MIGILIVLGILVGGFLLMRSGGTPPPYGTRMDEGMREGFGPGSTWHHAGDDGGT